MFTLLVFHFDLLLAFYHQHVDPQLASTGCPPYGCIVEANTCTITVPHCVDFNIQYWGTKQLHHFCSEINNWTTIIVVTSAYCATLC